MRPKADGLVAIGGSLSPELILEAYAKGVFPWTGEHPIPWYSPDPRMILEPAAFRARRSLRKARRVGHLEIRFDVAFDAVVAGCATAERPGQEGTWIVEQMPEVWAALSGRGLAHSVSAWRGAELVGGLYGLSLGAAFFGESMFASCRDASKLALWGLCEALTRRGFHFIDCQQETQHLARLGAVSISRGEYLDRLEVALAEPTLAGSWHAFHGAVVVPTLASPDTEHRTV